MLQACHPCYCWLLIWMYVEMLHCDSAYLQPLTNRRTSGKEASGLHHLHLQYTLLSVNLAYIINYVQREPSLRKSNREK